MLDEKARIRIAYNVINQYDNSIRYHMDSLLEMLVEENEGFHPQNCGVPHAKLVVEYSKQLHEFMQLMASIETEYEIGPVD